MLTDVQAVTACDETFAPLVRGTLASLRLFHPQISILLLDVGLEPATRQSLIAEFAIDCVTPEWHLDPAIIDHWSLEPWWRAMTARPHLPAYSKAKWLFWIDADAWIVSPNALPPFLKAARQPGCAFVGVPHASRCYDDQFGPDPLSGMLMLRSFYGSFLDENAALAHAIAPSILSGCFCAERTSPMWALWANRMTQLFAEATKRDNAIAPLIEQISLNDALASLPQGQVQRLPARFNWVLARSTPWLDLEAGSLCEPHPPHDPIEVLHLVQGGNKAEDKAATVTFPVIGPDGVPTSSQALEPRFETLYSVLKPSG